MQRVTLTSKSQNQNTASLDLSRIIYGMWRLGDDSDTTALRVEAKIEACLSQGITSFDQADIYGDYRCEKLLGQALKQTPSLRDKMEIITKCDIMLISENYPERRVKYYDTSATHIQTSIDNSLRNMNIETIDCLLIHRPDPFMNHHETGAALDGAIKSGKVKTVGVSNFKAHDWHLLQSAMKTPLISNQIEISLLAHDAFTNGDLAFHQMNAITPMAWSPLAGGALFDETNQQTAPLRKALKRIADEQNVGQDAIAVAWLLAHPANILPVLGTNNLTRIGHLSDALRVSMDRETWFELYTLALGNEVP